MREIIFRGKRMDNGEWVEGYYVRLYGSNGRVSRRIYTAYAEVDCGDYYPDFFEVIPSTVGQYTGLKDKNGKRIFEGDILVISGCKKYPVLVKFLGLGWVCVIPNEMHYRHRLESDYTKYEVVGNIHDNPELLEDT